MLSDGSKVRAEKPPWPRGIATPIFSRMLNDIRRIFQKSIEAFRQELGTREPEDEIAGLLASMRRELVAARAAIPEY